MMTLTRQTAANNAFLTKVKRTFNAAVYAEVLAIVNGTDGPVSGEANARRYLLANIVTTLGF